MKLECHPGMCKGRHPLPLAPPIVNKQTNVAALTNGRVQGRSKASKSSIHSPEELSNPSHTHFEELFTLPLGEIYTLPEEFSTLPPFEELYTLSWSSTLPSEELYIP